jgi:hypothetical protein
MSTETTKDILARDFSNEFIELMQNRIVVSHNKYGWMSKTYPELAQAVKSIQTRLDKYLETGNREWLVDIANFAMIEYMYPSHKNAHFRGTDSKESPGLTGGISYNEMMREIER